MAERDQDGVREREDPSTRDGHAEVGRTYGSLIDYPGQKSATREGGEAAESVVGDEEVLRKLDLTPTEPGVYLLRDHAGKVLYVGKAKSLRSRVRAYFRGG